MPDSRKRSASMERMPVVRFSSSGVSRGRRPCEGRREMLSPGRRTESSCMDRMMVLRASRTSAAEEKRAEGCFSRQRRMTDSSSTGRSGAISRMEGGSAYWMARMDLELGRVGAVEGMAAGGELVEDEAEGEDVGLDAGLAGDELLGRHVGDGAAAGGVGGAGDSLGGADFALVDGAAGVELGLVGTEAAGEAEVEDLDEAAVGEHDVGGLEVAVEDAEVVGGGEAVGGLNAGGEDELEAGRAFGDELVEALAGDVLHDDVGFFTVDRFRRGLRRRRRWRRRWDGRWRRRDGLRGAGWRASARW